MRQLDLTPAAIADIRAIAAFSSKQFGHGQTDRYLEKFDDLFDRLLDHPGIGSAIPGNKGRYRTRCGSHIVYYRYDDHLLRILRVIHMRRDQRKVFRAAND